MPTLESIIQFFTSTGNKVAPFIDNLPLARLTAANAFWYLTLLIFALESVWIALSAVFPQAFDENYHYGLIQLYSHHLWPLITRQPAGADIYGDVTRYSSYLFHYLMSFPYRLVHLFIKSQTGLIIALRLIDICLFGYGLVLFRKVIIRAGATLSLANLSLFLFVLIPIVPLLAGQINYDNLIFPLIGLTFLQGLKVNEQLRRRQVTLDLILLLALGLISSLVTYLYLPILLAVGLALIYRLIRSFGLDLKAPLLSLRSSLKRSSPLKVVLVLAFLILSSGLFIERDGLNLIKYHSVDPDCASVLSVKQCSAYSAWDYIYSARTYQSAHHLNAPSNLIEYVLQWSYWMWYRLFFAVNGPSSSFTNYPPLPLPALAGLLIGLGGLIIIVRYRRRIFKQRELTWLGFICLIYLVVLIARGYVMYKKTNSLVNMNGRYLLPLLLPLAAVAGQGLKSALKNRPRLKHYLVILVLVMFIEGGGILTFIARSDDSWYWPNQSVRAFNHCAKTITKYVILRGPETYGTHIWEFN